MTLQSGLLQSIFHGAFELVRVYLVFKHAFPNAMVIPGMVKKCLTTVAEARMTYNGRHNTLAGSVHQRLLVDDEYLVKMIQLVSSIISSVT